METHRYCPIKSSLTKKNVPLAPKTNKTKQDKKTTTTNQNKTHHNKKIKK